MAIVLMHELLSELGLTCCATNQEQQILERAIKRAEGAIRRHLNYDPEQRSHTEYYPGLNFSQTSRQSVWEVDGNEAVLRRLSEISTDELYVRHLPVRRSTVPQVFIDLDGRSGTTSGAFGTDTEKTEGTDFWPNYDLVDSGGDEVCSDGIIRSYGRWPTTPGTVKIIYTAGYTSNELKGEDDVIDASAIWDATLYEATRIAKTAITQGKSSRLGFLAGPLESERLGDYSYKIGGNSASRLFGGLYSLTPQTKEMLNEFVNYGWRIAG